MDAKALFGQHNEKASRFLHLGSTSTDLNMMNEDNQEFDDEAEGLVINSRQ